MPRLTIIYKKDRKELTYVNQETKHLLFTRTIQQFFASLIHIFYKQLQFSGQAWREFFEIQAQSCLKGFLKTFKPKMGEKHILVFFNNF